MSHYTQGSANPHASYHPKSLTSYYVQVKIVDFGFSKLIGDETCLTGFAGTVSFMAPEVIMGEAYGKVTLLILQACYFPYHLGYWYLSPLLPFSVPDLL